MTQASFPWTADDPTITADSLFISADGGISLPPPLRVMAVSAGTYAGQYYNPGDVFNILSQNDYSDSTRNYNGAGYIWSPGWMLYVAASTPLYQAEVQQPYPTFPRDRSKQAIRFVTLSGHTCYRM